MDNASLAAGATIKIKATVTPYSEATITTSKGGVSGSPITITRYDGDTGKPVWTGASGGRLQLNHPYYVIDNVDIDNANISTTWIVKVNAPNTTLKNCKVHNSVSQGIQIQDTGDNTTIDNCELYDIGSAGDKHAITTGRSPDPTAYVTTGLTVTNNTIHDIGGDGIQLYETSGACRQATVTGLIQGNTLWKGTRSGHENAMDIKIKSLVNDPLIIAGNTITGWDGSSTSQGNRAVVIQHCPDYVKFRDNFVRSDGPGNEGLTCNPCMGVNISASTATASAPVVGVEVIGNVFVGMRDAIEIGDGSSATAHSDLKIFNNTAYRVTRAMFRVKGPVTAGEFRNNLNFNGPTMSCSTGGSLAGTTTSHNGWFGTAAQQGSCAVSCGGVDLCDATDTKGTDPFFTNPAGDDFTLQTGSPVINKGTPVGLSYNGTAPDLGAKETGGPPPPADTTPPTGVGNVSPSNGAAGVSLTPTLTAATATDATPPVSYAFELYQGSACLGAPVQTRAYATSTSWFPSALTANATYAWRNRARDSAATPNESGFGSCWTLTTSLCTENWQCGDWSICANNQQTRTCTDLNNCGTITNRSALSQSCIPPTTTKPTSLISTGETWKYFKGTVDPNAAWRNVSFDDSAWLNGPTGIGYGDGDDATVLNDMAGNYLTVYARKNFTVNDPATVTGLTLNVDYDDGFVAYLNGQEVARASLPSGTPTRNTAAVSHEAGSPGSFNLSTAINLLTAGTNVLAIEVHNTSISSSDLSLIPALVATVSTPPDTTPPAAVSDLRAQ